MTERPTLYEFAGGDEAFRALAVAHHARCLADSELNHPFSHGIDPAHVEHLAWYWAEVFGGPPRYSEALGGHRGMIGVHAGQGINAPSGERFIECFVVAADDAGLPEDAEFRAALRAYMEWATAEVLSFSPEGSEVPANLATPRWSWSGLSRT